MPITSETVLVLGAGASQPYGFPLGVELRDRVCALVPNFHFEVFFRQMGHAEGALRTFVDELRFSAHTSVDVFLEHNPDFLTIGKQAIATVLLPCEDPDALFPPRVKAAKSWYEYLVNLMGVGTKAWGQNKLSVVTFNYDRSFEHYFTTVIGRRAHVKEEAAHKLFTQVEFVHVHGSLGNYALGGRDSLAYGVEVSPDSIKAAAEQILVVSEVDGSLPTFDQAEALLRRARRIYFLGLGFSQDNVRRLRVFDDAHALDDVMIVSGTSYGITDPDWHWIRERVLHECWTGERVKSATVPDFIRRHANLG